MITSKPTHMYQGQSMFLAKLQSSGQRLVFITEWLKSRLQAAMSVMLTYAMSAKLLATSPSQHLFSEVLSDYSFWHTFASSPVLGLADRFLIFFLLLKVYIAQNLVVFCLKKPHFHIKEKMCKILYFNHSQFYDECYISPCSVVS